MSSALPQPRPPEASGQRRSSLVPLLLGCGAALLVVLALGSIGAVLAWRGFVSYAIATDFTAYQTKVRSMDLDPEVKQALLERLERLRERARAAPISIWRWVDYDESVHSLIEDEELTGDELEALNRELDRMEADFR
jgi:hypothetical protein